MLLGSQSKKQNYPVSYCADIANTDFRDRGTELKRCTCLVFYAQTMPSSPLFCNLLPIPSSILISIFSFIPLHWPGKWNSCDKEYRVRKWQSKWNACDGDGTVHAFFTHEVDEESSQWLMASLCGTVDDGICKLITTQSSEQND